MDQFLYTLGKSIGEALVFGAAILVIVLTACAITLAVKSTVNLLRRLRSSIPPVALPRITKQCGSHWLPEST
jgi:hypothetical protein